MRTLLTTLAVTAAALIAIPALADCGSCGTKEAEAEGEGRCKLIVKLDEAVDLDEDQEAAIQALHDEMHADVAPLKQRFHALHEELAALWNADDLDADAILAKHAEFAALSNEKEQRKLAFKLAVLGELEGEQRATAKKMFLDSMMGHGKGGHHGDGHKGCDKGHGDGHKGCDKAHADGQPCEGHGGDQPCTCKAEGRECDCKKHRGDEG